MLFPVAMLVFVTALSFVNAWPDEVVLDDKFFVNNEHLPDWTEPAELFRGDVWRTAGSESNLYRPALLLSLSLDSRLFGGWLPGYHLSSILLHLLVTLLVYGFLRHLLQAAPPAPSPRPAGRADLYALLGAMVFAVHPVHTEVVNSVFNRSDMLVSLGGVAGLWWLLYFLESRPALAWAGLGMAYLFALLCKENAVVIPGLAVVLILLLSAESWGRRIRRSIPVLSMLLPLGLYLYLRAHALAPTAAVAEAGVSRITEMAGDVQIMGPENLLDLVGKWGVGLRLMVWPHPLQLNYPALPTSTAAALTGAQLALIVAGLAQLRRGRSVLLAGLAWFYLALLPASRLFAPGVAEPHLAERYLYFPSVGAALALAFALVWLGARFGPRRTVILSLLAIAVMMPLTWVRNNEWGTDLRLFETEYRRSGTYKETLRFLTGGALSMGNRSRAAEICDRHADLLEPYPSYAINCGLAYAQLERPEDAERAFLLASESGRYPSAASHLASLYLSQGRRMDAIVQFQRAIDQEKNPAIKNLRRGFQLAYLFPTDPESLAKARGYFAEAYRMEPVLKIAEVWVGKMDRALANLEE
jgi:tetratricopeptide (TPR) repeat protein